MDRLTAVYLIIGGITLVLSALATHVSLWLVFKYAEWWGWV